jgi:hypothetical protein
VGREYEQISNETPFMVVPAATPTAPATLTGLFDVNGGLFQDPALPASAVRMYVSDTQLSVGTGGALLPGQFAVINPTQIAARLPGGLVPGKHVPIRLVINGAESLPAWVQVP